MFSLVLACIAALLLDALWGEPRRWHPLVVFGGIAGRLEARFNREPGRGLWRGALAVLVLVVPLVGLMLLLTLWLPDWLLWPVQVVVLWWALALRSLDEHGEAVVSALRERDLPRARWAVSRIVSRDGQALDEGGVARAATESVLENGADGVFASLFWFLLAGLPGVVLHRLINTLDAMWGYRNPRFERFGKVAARFDDLLGWLPARLTALSYAICGNTRTALRCWRLQGRQWYSPNAGPVMAAGAGALRVRLGGAAPYADGWKSRPPLGEGYTATASSITDALRLVRHGVWLWMLTGLLLTMPGLV